MLLGLVVAALNGHVFVVELFVLLVAVVSVAVVLWVVFLAKVDEHILEEDVAEVEEVWVHWSVKRITEGLSIVVEFAKHGQREGGHLALFHGVDEDKQFVGHATNASLGQVQVVGEAEDLVAVGEGLVALDGLQEFLVEVVSTGPVLGNKQ
ncbi:hypothetical protein A0H77_23425 [Vibrio alginolyticus]|nr:hypothetical protein A0H77_23425 [Vibrio alginolyticus]